MTKMKYESPKFDFQEMKLAERVADKCWGAQYCWVDHDGDPSTPSKEWEIYKSETTNGCEGNDPKSVAERLALAKEKFPEISDKLKEGDVKVNIQGSEFISMNPS